MELKRGDRIRLKVEKYSYGGRRWVPVGTEGTVLSTRASGMGEGDVLVKFKGVGCPLSVERAHLEPV